MGRILDADSQGRKVAFLIDLLDVGGRGLLDDGLIPGQRHRRRLNSVLDTVVLGAIMAMRNDV